jgi:glycosyltransferase involved in cell wall biosynthesis
MHILFLSHYFPPEVNAPASRTSEHCRQWVADGEDVTVVTCVPNHPHGKIFPGFRNRLFQRSWWDGVRVIRVLTYITPNEGFLKRTANYVFYMIAATIAALFTRRADVVVTTSPQFFNGLAGYLVSIVHRAPWVLEIRDLWPESILELGAIKSRRIIALLHAMARFAYRKADHIVVVTEAFRHNLLALGIPSEKITVIKNGVDLSVFKSAPRDEGFLAANGLQGRFVASYVGTHGMAHGLEVILEAAQLLRGRPDIGFLLVGDGADRRRLLAKRDEMGLKNVVMLELQGRDRMPAIWSATDASLIVLRDKPVFRTVIPSKMFETMAMKKPIILGVAGESRQIVEEAGAGLCIPPEDSRALADAVRKLADDSALAARLGDNGYRYVTQNHDRVVLARFFNALLRTISAAHRPERSKAATAANGEQYEAPRN